MANYVAPWRNELSRLRGRRDRARSTVTPEHEPRGAPILYLRPFAHDASTSDLDEGTKGAIGLTRVGQAALLLMQPPEPSAFEERFSRAIAHAHAPLVMLATEDTPENLIDATESWFVSGDDWKSAVEIIAQAAGAVVFSAGSAAP